MKAIALASTKDISHEDWAKWRRTGIGGSDVSAIAGLSRWKSPIAIWMEKTGQVEPKEIGEAGYWGKILEDIVAKEFSRRTGLKVQRRNAILRHPRHPFMLANIDRMIVDKEMGRGVLECKTAIEYKKEEWEEGIPEEYAIQVHHYLAVTGLQFARIAVLIGGNKFEIKDIERDEEIIDYLEKIESDFWQLVKNGTPPAMDGSDSSSDLLKILYPESQPTIINLPSDAESMVEEFLRFQAMEKSIGLEKDRVANQLKEMIGSNETAYTLGYKINWKTVNTKRFDTTRFKVDQPATYKDYINETKSRRFAVSENKAISIGG